MLLHVRKLCAPYLPLNERLAAHGFCHLPSAEATEEGPCKIVLSLERAHRPAQQQNRQEELDNLAENLDNDGVEITVVHDHQLLEAARSLSTTTVIGPFCFFKVNEGCSHDRGKQTNPQ